MGRKKKGLGRRLLSGAAKYSWLGAKAVAHASWRGASWAVRKGVEFAKKTRTDSGRSANPPEFAGLKEVEKESGALPEFEDFVYGNKSTIGIILGARGSGKSVLGMKLLENAAGRGRKTVAMGFDEATLPKWIRVIQPNEISAVANGSFILVDEGGITFGSRDSMSSANKLLSELLFVSRHKDLSVLFISQNSANLEVNAIRQADYLLLKRPSLLQKDFERKKINEIYEKTREGFGRLREKSVFYVYSDAFVGFASNGLPSFWSERVSKAFAQQKLERP